jgi:hypothetical protein
VSKIVAIFWATENPHFHHKKHPSREQKPFLRVDILMKRYNGAVCKHVKTSIQERVCHETVRQVTRPHTAAQAICAFTGVYSETFNSVPFKGAVTVQKSAACRILSFS